MVTDIDIRVKSMYKLAKACPEDQNLQEAIEVIKTLRRSQSQSVRRREESKIEKQRLKSEIVQLSQENLKLGEEVTSLSHNINSLQSELTTLNSEMVQLTQDKQRIIAQRDRVIAELKNIETEVEIATQKVQEANSWYGKFTIIWTLIQSLFFSDEPETIGTIDKTLPDYPDQPQMNTDPASIGRDLLDK